MKIQINKYHILYALVFIFVLTGCKVRRPKEVIPENQMEELLYDYHIAKALGENLPHNENYKRALYVEYVFKKHNTTEAAFDTSMVWYTRHADVLSKMYERVSKKLKAERDEIDNLIAIRDNKPKTSAPGDSIDIWLLDRMMLLTDNPLNNKLTFAIPSDSNFKARDTIQWDMYYYFLDEKSDSTESALMAMAIQYANDSVISKTNRVHESGLQSIRLQADTLGDIKEVRGYVYYSAGNNSAKHLLANHISLMRYHSNDSLFAEKTDSIATKEKEAVPATPKVEEEKVEEPAVQQPERVNPNELRRRRPAQKAETTEEVTEE